MVQWDLLQVQSPARHSGFKDPALLQYHIHIGRNCGLDLIPGLGIPYAVRHPKGKKKKKKANIFCCVLTHSMWKSLTRDQTCTTAANLTTAVTMLDP